MQYRLDADGYPEEVWCDSCAHLLGLVLADGTIDFGATERQRETERDKWLCEQCAEESDWESWLDATMRLVAVLIDGYGWRGAVRIESPRSRCYDLAYKCDRCRYGAVAGFPCSCQTMELRISDRTGADFGDVVSLAMHPSDSDSTIEELAARLAKPSD